MIYDSMCSQLNWFDNNCHEGRSWVYPISGITVNRTDITSDNLLSVSTDMT